ncbi:hypothetical protein [Leekyejoonella antrihumi]|nr:hypothetical protein [Leekyejoonella antrihumi]
MLELAAPAVEPWPVDLSVGHYDLLDREERRAVDLFASVGLVAASEAVGARAWCEPVVDLRSSG